MVYQFENACKYCGYCDDETGNLPWCRFNGQDLTENEYEEQRPNWCKLKKVEVQNG